MAPCSINCSNTVASCSFAGWPGVSTNVTGLPLPLPLPLPSHLTCILVPNPPLLQPKASVSGPQGPSFGSPFLHPVPSGRQPHSGEREYWCRLRNGWSIGPRQACLPFAVARQALGPKLLLYASGTAGRRQSWESRNARASPPIGHLYWAPVLSIQRMPLTIVLWSLFGLPVLGFCGGSSGSSFSHCSSVSSCLRGVGVMSIVYQPTPLCR